MPLANTKVILVADDAHSGRSDGDASITLVEEFTDISGRFLLKSKQSKRHPKYYIKSDARYNVSFDTTFNVSSSLQEIGNLITGSHTFSINLRCQSITQHCAIVNFDNKSFNLEKGQDTLIPVQLKVGYHENRLYKVTVQTKKYCVSPAEIRSIDFRLDTTDTKTIGITF